MGKIGELLCPVVLKQYVVQKKLTNLENSLALGLQRGVNSVFVQCVPCAGLSEVLV